jgi:chloride channel protein, CIC family
MVHYREDRGTLPLLALLSCMVGAATGFVAAVFRIALQQADRWRYVWITRTYAWPAPGWLFTVGAIAAMAASAAWLVERFSPQAAGSGFLFLGLGILAGLAGTAYDATILGALNIASRIPWRAEWRAAWIGGVVGLLAWFAPKLVGGSLVGGGDSITQRALSGMESMALLPLVFGVRFLLGPLSYAASTPGGLFAPMLVLGAQLGLLFATLCHLALPHFGAPPTAFAVVGMAAFFTAVVRTPVAGIVLVTELTAGFTQLIPMLWASFAATVVPTILGSDPIYESLSQPAFLRERGGKSE